MIPRPSLRQAQDRPCPWFFRARRRHRVALHPRNREIHRQCPVLHDARRRVARSGTPHARTVGQQARSVSGTNGPHDDGRRRDSLTKAQLLHENIHRLLVVRRLVADAPTQVNQLEPRPVLLPQRADGGSHVPTAHSSAISSLNVELTKMWVVRLAFMGQICAPEQPKTTRG